MTYLFYLTFIRFSHQYTIHIHQYFNLITSIFNIFYLLILRKCILYKSTQHKITLRFITKTQHKQHHLNQLWRISYITQFRIYRYHHICYTSRHHLRPHLLQHPTYKLLQWKIQFLQYIVYQFYPLRFKPNYILISTISPNLLLLILINNLLKSQFPSILSPNPFLRQSRTTPKHQSIIINQSQYHLLFFLTIKTYLMHSRRLTIKCIYLCLTTYTFLTYLSKTYLACMILVQ